MDTWDSLNRLPENHGEHSNKQHEKGTCWLDEKAECHLYLLGVCA